MGTSTVDGAGRLRRTLAAVAGALLVALLLVAPPFERTAVAAGDAPGPAVTVSLTYDDGTADQLQAADLMARYGMKGTFYLNSSRLGAAGRMTTAQATALQSAGHEIGGHTVTHADLPTLDIDEQKRQICDDRVSLLNAGFKVSNFAYPYGDDSAATHQAVAGCGYNSARVVGDIVSPGSCNGCPYAEKLPPANPYAVRTPDSIKPTTTLESMENFVLQAEANSGGWVVLVMHRVCDDCDPYAVNAEKLDAFLSWLSTRSGRGTVVKTVAEVIGGPVKAAVKGPPPAPRLADGEMLRNASMETDTSGDGLPDCWQRGGYGANTAVWSKASPPHTGSVAQQVTISSFTDGDRRILTPQDLGGCAPETVSGHTYRVAGWYRTNGTNGRLVAYYRDGQSRWIYLSQGPAVAPNPTEWKQAVWTTPALPAGARALSVGFSLRSAGFAAGDDFSVTDTDQTPPAVDLTSPDDGTRLRGTVTFTATAADAAGVERVEFMVDGKVACTTTVAPYRCVYDSTARPDTVIAVSVRAFDTAGNAATSEGRNYTVSNSVPADGVAPVVTLVKPIVAAVLSRSVALTANAVDDDEVSRVLFYAGDALIGSSDTAPYTMTWDTRTMGDAPMVLQAKALDLSGNLGSSLPVPVVLNNDQFDTTTPTSTASCNEAACTTNWYTKPVSVALSATDTESGVSRIVYTTDGSEPGPTNGSTYAAALTVSTPTTVRYRAYDRAGNAEEARSLALKVDTGAPTARVSAPADQAAVTGPTYIQADVGDANGIARVYFYLDGKALGSRTATPYQWRWDPTGTAAGAHTLQVMAVDPAGNQTRSAVVTVRVG